MKNTVIKPLFWMLLAFYTFNLLTIGESKPQAGVIFGGLVGSSTNFTLAPNISNNSFPAGHNPREGIYSVFQTKVPAIIIERGETLSNGCYQQTVEEPFHSDITRFISTQQLVCPPGVNVSSIPQRFLRPAHAPSFVPTPKTQPAVDAIQSNFSGHSIVPFFAPAYHSPADLNIFENATLISVLPPPSKRLVALHETAQPDIFQMKQSMNAKVPEEANSHVILLSQNTGYYNSKSDASPAKWNVMVIVITLFIVVLCNYDVSSPA